MRAWAVLFASLAASSGCGAGGLPPDVQAVVDRSHSSRANYAVILTVEVIRDGRRTVETNAEFHQGPMHRVEVPHMRVLTNCETGAAQAYDVAAAAPVEGPDPGAATCGVAVGADRVLSGRRLEPVEGPYGRADVIELTGEDFVRRYAVTDDGIIVANEYRPRRPEVGLSLRTLAASVRRGPQDPAMFVPASLDRAFAPPAGAPDGAPRSP
ncbi:MAG TPA: hypothetical protein VFZ91_05665 [Allosphingosinicella sp.]